MRATKNAVHSDDESYWANKTLAMLSYAHIPLLTAILILPMALCQRCNNDIRKKRSYIE